MSEYKSLAKKSESNFIETVDAIALYGSEIILIQRRDYPSGIAIPGGHVDPGESLDDAVVRELREETNLGVKSMKKFGVYSTPGRDPRGKYRSTVYVCKTYGIPEAGSDAKSIVRIKLKDLDNYKESFAFDHHQILSDYKSKNNL
ncbi:NUDIX hydrolase [Candidatus Woesearchaeota archaeon]|nr:NUDIX hydrolase [Candidatus Woesearchaeota archaeon]